MDSVLVTQGTTTDMNNLKNPQGKTVTKYLKM